MEPKDDPERTSREQPRTDAVPPVEAAGGGPPRPEGHKHPKLLPVAIGTGIACLLALGAFVLSQHRILERIETLRGAASDEAGAGMVEVPAGESLMGSSDPKAPPEQRPEHKVALKAFLIDKVEVSNARFQEFVGATKADPPKNLSPEYDLWQDGNMPPEIADLPVTNVDWDQASAFCKWAGKRLPTEAEWEKAARGTDGRRYPWGDADPDPTLANFGRTWSGATSFDRVDSHPEGASPYGALGMAGNVAEWVADWHDAAYYQNSPPADPIGPESGEARSIRGGSFEGKADTITTTFRDSLNPGDHFFKDVGFRCAKSIQ